MMIYNCQKAQDATKKESVESSPAVAGAKRNSFRLFRAVVLCMICGGWAACHSGDGRYDATGSFEATEVIVSSEANGRLMRFDVEEGQPLAAGQYVGYVDSMQLYLKKCQLEAGRRSVEVRKPDVRKQIASLEQQIATALTERKRMENLVKAHSANQKQLDDIDENIKYLEKQLVAQRSTLNKTTSGADREAESMDYQILQLDDQLEKCRLVNPVAGTVLVKYAEPSEVTAAGKPLYKIADLDRIFLRVYITADQLSTVKLGQAVKVYADFGKKERREYPGTISWISGKSEFTPKGIQTKDERQNLVYAVKIKVVNDGYLKIGQYGEAVF